MWFCLRLRWSRECIFLYSSFFYSLYGLVTCLYYFYSCGCVYVCDGVDNVSFCIRLFYSLYCVYICDGVDNVSFVFIFSIYFIYICDGVDSASFVFISFYSSGHTVGTTGLPHRRHTARHQRRTPVHSAAPGTHTPWRSRHCHITTEAGSRWVGLALSLLVCGRSVNELED